MCRQLCGHAFQVFTVVYLKNMHLVFGGRYLISWEYFLGPQTMVGPDGAKPIGLHCLKQLHSSMALLKSDNETLGPR